MSCLTPTTSEDDGGIVIEVESSDRTHSGQDTEQDSVNADENEQAGSKVMRERERREMTVQEGNEVSVEKGDQLGITLRIDDVDLQ